MMILQRLESEEEVLRVESLFKQPQDSFNVLVNFSEWLEKLEKDLYKSEEEITKLDKIITVKLKRSWGWLLSW